MLFSILSLCALVLTITPTLATSHQARHGPHSKLGAWRPGDKAGKYLPCTKETMRVRQDFDNMKPIARKAYTDAVLCLMKQPSQLDQVTYPAATNRFLDYAVIHVNHTKVVHLDGYFLTVSTL